jgi:plastocyanin
LSKPTSSHAYGIGIITIIVGVSAGLIYYQMFYLPESLAKPSVSEEILEPIEEKVIEIILGSADPNQQDNFIPKLVNIQLGIDNKVIWKNVDNTAHTVTPDHRTEDSYSGEFGSPGVIKPGETYEFLFTQPNVIPYHCEPHPWMKGTLEITKQRF